VTQPYCRWCGKAIAKRSKIVWVAEEPQSEPRPGHVYTGKGHRLRSKAECQPYTNQTILSVKYMEERDDDNRVIGRYVWSFTVWDGETYIDQYFCNGEHARFFGYAMAKKGWGTMEFHKVVMFLNPTNP